VTWKDRLIAIGARHIDDDARFGVLRVDFVPDGGEGAEEQVAGVGHDGGAARGDAVFGLEMKEAGEELVDGDGGLEFGEGGGEIDGSVFMLRELRVAAAEERLGAQDKEAAAGAVEEAMLTTALSRCSRPGRDRPG
jgi:hypothetical protein